MRNEGGDEMTILGWIALEEVGMFIGGFIYTLVLGNKKTRWIERCLGGAVFFALWFITIPWLMYSVWLDRRSQ